MNDGLDRVASLQRVYQKQLTYRSAIDEIPDFPTTDTSLDTMTHFSFSENSLL